MCPPDNPLTSQNGSQPFVLARRNRRSQAENAGFDSRHPRSLFAQATAEGYRRMTVICDDATVRVVRVVLLTLAVGLAAAPAALAQQYAPRSTTSSTSTTSTSSTTTTAAPGPGGGGSVGGPGTADEVEAAADARPGGGLPTTGGGGSALEVGRIGLAAVAVGAGLVLMARRRQHRLPT
jgi:hypothetical protein